MLSQKLHDYLLKTNYTFDDSIINGYNHTTWKERKEIFQIQTKTISRRAPSLSPKATLIIEGSMVILVLMIVCFVFYCSHRNFKKRTNVHRRRWLESDVNIEVYSDGQIYDDNNSPEENPPTDLDQNDCPPPYELAIQQPKAAPQMVSRNSKINKPRKSEQIQNTTNRNSIKPSSGDEDFEVENSLLNEQSPLKPLIATREPIHNVENSGEISSLIQSSRVASTSIVDMDCERNRKEPMRQDEINIEIHDEVPTLQSLKTVNNSSSVGQCALQKTGINNELEKQAELHVLDTTGLPSYDTALKIKECGNI